MSNAPKLGKIRRTTGVAGQIAYTTTTTYPGEEESGPVTFVGSVYGGPVVMVTETMPQIFVRRPDLDGVPLSPEWVRRFFKATT